MLVGAHTQHTPFDTHSPVPLWFCQQWRWGALVTQMDYNENKWVLDSCGYFLDSGIRIHKTSSLSTKCWLWIVEQGNLFSSHKVEATNLGALKMPSHFQNESKINPFQRPCPSSCPVCYGVFSPCLGIRRFGGFLETAYWQNMFKAMPKYLP